MKRQLILLLALVVMTGMMFTGCGSKSKDDTVDASTQVQDQQDANGDAELTDEGQADTEGDGVSGDTTQSGGQAQTTGTTDKSQEAVAQEQKAAEEAAAKKAADEAAAKKKAEEDAAAKKKADEAAAKKAADEAAAKKAAQVEAARKSAEAAAAKKAADEAAVKKAAEEATVIDVSGEQEQQQAAEKKSPTKADAQGYVGKSKSSLVAAIGSPNSTDYASSCIGDGEDGELRYDGFTVYTYRENGSEVVTDVM